MESKSPSVSSLQLVCEVIFDHHQIFSIWVPDWSETKDTIILSTFIIGILAMHGSVITLFNVQRTAVVCREADINPQALKTQEILSITEWQECD